MKHGQRLEYLTFHFDCPFCSFHTILMDKATEHLHMEHRLTLEAETAKAVECSCGAGKADMHLASCDLFTDVEDAPAPGLLPLRPPPTDTLYTCPRCDYSSSTGEAVRKHAEEMHPGFQCGAICGYTLNPAFNEATHEMGPAPQAAPPQTPPEVAKVETILDEAKRLIHGDRKAAYGPFTDEARRLARGWSDITGVEIQARHVPLMMIWLKVTRQAHSSRRDNYVDLAGYAALGQQFEEETGGK